MMTPRQFRPMSGLLQNVGILLMLSLLVILVPAGISHEASRVSQRAMTSSVTGIPTLFLADFDDDNADRETLYGIDASIGTTRWSITSTPSLQPDPPFAGFFGGTGLVYLNDGNARAFNAENGTSVWTQNRPPATATTPVGFNNMVLAGGDDGLQRSRAFLARNAVTGALVWLTPIPFAPTRGVVTSVNGTSLVSFSSFCCSDDVIALNATTGDQVWQTHLASVNAQVTAPTVDAARGLVYVASTDQNVYALDAGNGGIKWTFFAGASLLATPRVINGFVYVGTTTGVLYALDADSGSVRWSFSNNQVQAINTTPLVVNNLIYFIGSDGTVYAHNATHGGLLVWTFHPTFLSVAPLPLAFANGLLYEAVDSRPPSPQSDVVSVYAFNASNGAYQWRWDGIDHGRLDSVGNAAPPVIVV